MVIWICGLSASGKTTLGRHLYSVLKPNTENLVLLDGDDLRSVMADSTGYDSKSRKQNSARIGKMCQLLDSQDIHVICCAVTISSEVQAFNREHLSGYCEVYLDVSLNTAKKRDPKGIYRGAERGEIDNVAGVDVEYEPPANPHLIIDNNVDRQDMQPLANSILERVNSIDNDIISTA